MSVNDTLDACVWCWIMLGVCEYAEILSAMDG